MLSHSRLVASLGTIACSLMIAVPAPAQECVDYQDYMQWTGVLDLDGACNAVALSGQYGFMATSTTVAALQVVDLTIPEDPQLAAVLPLPGWPDDVAVAGNLAFVAAQHSGLQIIDISDPLAPVLLSEVPTPGAAGSVASHGQFAVVAEWETGRILVVDVSDPVAPFICGTVQGENDIWGLTVAEGFAYTVWHTASPGNAGLQVIDLADPTLPVIVAELAVSDWAWEVAVDGEYAYVVSGSGLDVIDISDPATPLVVGNGGHGGRNIAVADGLAFVGTGPGTNGVWINDISNPPHPFELGAIRTLDEARDIAVQGSIVVTANTYTGMNVIDVGPPLPAPAANLVEDLGSVLDMTIAGDRAYLSGYSRLRIADLSDPMEPVILGELITPGVVKDVAVGDFVYMIDDSTGLFIVDVSSPQEPVVVGHWDGPGRPLYLALAGEHLFVTTVTGSDPVFSLCVIDVSQPESPVLVGVEPLPPGADHIAVAEGVAYVTCAQAGGFSGLVLVDVTDPTNPVQTGNVVLTGRVFYEVLVRDTWAFVATLDDGVVIVDVANPQFPIAAAVATIPPGGCVDLALSGKILYSALRSAGMAVHDVSDPHNPIYLGHASAPARGVCVAAGEQFVYLGVGGVLQVCFLQCDAPVSIEETHDDDVPPLPVLTTRLVGVAPNPFNPRTAISFSVDYPQQVKITVYDAAGRLVARLADGVFSAGDQQVVWDGLDVHGKGCSSGLYLVQMQSADGIEVCKVMLAR